MKLSVHKKTEKAFKQRAVAALPNEHLELVFGRRGDDLIEVMAIVPVKINVATKDYIRYNDRDAKTVKSRMARLGLSWLGTIHSHPYWEASPSIADHCGGVADREAVMGILSIYPRPKRHVLRVLWWVPNTPLDVSYQ